MTNLTKLIITGAIVIVGLILFSIINPFSYNDGGNRTVVQQSGGEQFVQFKSGIFYAGFFAKEKEWPNQISVLYTADKPDYDLEDNGIEIGQIKVQFNEATTAEIKGITQYILPSDEKEMILLHNTHRTPESLVSKRLAPYTKACLQSAAQLMSSEMHYSGGRAQMSQDFQNQLTDGPYLLSIQERVVFDSTENSKKRIYQANIQLGKDGLPKRKASSIKEYGITVADAQTTDVTYETRVTDKIAKVIDAATKSAISKQELMTAQQQALTAKAKGEQALVEIEYKQKQEQTKQVVAAETKVEVAKQDLLQQEVQRQAAYKEADKIKTLADANAYEKQRNMTADGALDKKLAAYIEVQKAWATAFQNYDGSITPTYMMGGSSSSNNAMQNFMELQNAKAMRDLNLNLNSK